jgi:hypothetical protein
MGARHRRGGRRDQSCDGTHDRTSALGQRGRRRPCAGGGAPRPNATGDEPGGFRGGYARGMARVTRSNDNGLADLITREVGEPLQAARGELEFAALYADSMAGWDRRSEARPPRRATPTATLPRAAPANRCGCGVSSILPITDSSALVSGAEPPIWSSSPLLRRVHPSSGPPV